MSDYINPKAEEWIQALESGEYKQGKHKLKKKVGDEVCYCCLGVAAELQDKLEQLNSEVWVIKQDATELFLSSCLSNSVKKELGLKHPMGLADKKFIVNGYEADALYSANDSGMATFKQIAEVLRAKPELFFYSLEEQQL